MPIAFWTCSVCGQPMVPLDHYATTACGEKVHPDYVAAVLADRELQGGREGVRVSMGLSCPRKAAIMEQEDVAVDPTGMLSPLKGTAWHAMMERSAKALVTVSGSTKGGNISINVPEVGAEIEVHGEIGGVKLSGKIDRVRYVSGKLVGEDWKTGSDFRVKYLRKTEKNPDAGSPIEYRIQLSIYAELYHQQFGKRWDSASIWWAFSNDMWVEAIDIIDINDCLSHKPNGCEFTVLQLLQQAEKAINGDVKWNDLPLAGASITFGTKTACDYCAVRGTCMIDAVGAPF